MCATFAKITLEELGVGCSKRVMVVLQSGQNGVPQEATVTAAGLIYIHFKSKQRMVSMAPI